MNSVTSVWWTGLATGLAIGLGLREEGLPQRGRASGAETDGGMGLPESLWEPKHLLRGLFCDIRDLDNGLLTGLAGLNERVERRSLGLSGVEPSPKGRCESETASEERDCGEPAGVVEAWRALEGDRAMAFRKDRTECMCVGEGRVSVPPLPFGYDISWTTINVCLCCCLCEVIGARLEDSR